MPRKDGLANFILDIIESPNLESETTYSIAAGGTQTLPKGLLVISPGANTTVEYTPDGGTTWRTIAGGLVLSDGESFRLNNGGAAAEDSYVLNIG
jgi:hypothetical protein